MSFKRLAILCVVACFLLQAQGADKYTDGNRPYEFGFTIDGEQHRQEKKDEKGLIMGEFGFITADGVYHVTVYATDEQGRFKILSMKNIRVKPYPSYKKSNGSARQGHSLDVSAPTQTITPQVSTQKPIKRISIQPPANSCSHCSIPTTSTLPPVGSPQEVPNSPVSIPDYPNIINTPALLSGNQQSFPKQNYPQQISGNFPSTQSGSAPKLPQNIGQNPPQYQGSPQISNYPQQELSLPKEPQYNQPNFGASQPQYPLTPNQPDTRPQNGFVPSSRTPKRLDDNVPQTFEPQNNIRNAAPNALPKKPVLINAQMQIVDKNTDIYKRGPGEREGLPDGLTKNDMSNLLYTFNYTVGFHGHFEEGYTNGVKQGYYFVTGRNGVRTRIDYIADSKGFRPKITQEVLDLLSDDVPKPETEKDAKYGLKGYEFKWLYYPVESKGR